jgi:predicted HD superfamily hydrolase involved in NAD metabolism
MQTIRRLCPYICWIEPTGDVEADVRVILAANGKPATLQHVLKVAETAMRMAQRWGLEEGCVSQAALLHDVSAIMRPSDMLLYAQEQNWPLSECETAHPFLLHQRVSRAMAEKLFHIRDERVLSPIECHTTLRPGCDRYDLTLFLADKLAWDQDGAPPYEALVTRAMEKSPGDAALTYIEYALKNGLILEPHPDLLAAQAYLKKFMPK